MAVSGQNLIDGAMDLADMVSDPHVSPATWLRWANRAMEKLWRKMLPIHSGFYVGTTDFTLAGGAGGNSVVLNASTRAVLGVTKDPDNPALRTALLRRNFQEREEQYQRTFDIVGTNIEVRPAEYAAGTYRYWRVFGPTALTAAIDLIDGWIEPYAEYMETYMAIKAKGKEESDATDLAQDLKDIWEEIEGVVMNRNMGAGETIVDVDLNGGVWPNLVRP